MPGSRVPQNRGMSEHLTTGSTTNVSPAHDRLLVGFDGSQGSVAAVDWAAAEATARGASLLVVMGRALPEAVDFSGIGARQIADLEELAQHIAVEHPTLDLDIAATVLDPRDALIREASGADLLVLGSTERGAAHRLLFGSVAHSAARRSPCPLVVVRGRRSTAAIHTIAVGADGSSASDAALLWAAAEAELHVAEIIVVHGWDRSGVRADATAILDDAVTRCSARCSRPVRGDLFDGDAATALTAWTIEADLLAIGSRGRSGFRTALFGSVALAVAEHAMCPVVITHPRPRA